MTSIPVIPGSPSKVNLLSRELGSLAHGLPPAQPDTLFVLGNQGGMSVAPDVDFAVTFGRNEPDVHVCVGAGDQHVSRIHGVISRQYGRWMLNNVGRLPIRLPGARMVLGGDQAELPRGYTPLFIVGPDREHLLQVRVAAPVPALPQHSVPDLGTVERDAWPLTAAQRLVVTCLAQRYLRGDTDPQPLTWAMVSAELTELRPAEKWGVKRCGHLVGDLREKLSTKVPRLTEREVAPPVGNTLNHNLIMELLISGTLTREDLELLEARSA